MTILDEINAHKRVEIADAKRKAGLADLKNSHLFTRATNSLKGALREPGASGIIAEFKTKSPSKGVINSTADVMIVTSGYVAAGVSGLSVLTDNHFFGGSLADLVNAREANPLTPVLRKDFILDPYQIYEAKACGADLILLIAASLTKDEMLVLARTARELGLEVLAEFHTEAELEKLNPLIDIVGVNNRNLKTFEVDLEISVRLGSLLPEKFVRISESGLSTAENIRYLRKAGFEGFLMGENFMKTPDPARACKQFIGEIGEFTAHGSRLSVKVCGMRDPENINQVSQAGPDFIGYIFQPESSRYVGKEPDPSIFEQVPSSIVKVGVFVNEKPGSLLQLCRQYGLPAAQLHGNETPAFCQTLKENNLTVIKAFSLHETFDFNQLKDYLTAVDYFLFDTKGNLRGGTGTKFDWKILERYPFDIPFFLSGGIRPADTAELKKLKHPQLFAIDINSGFETAPALKDAGAVGKFMEEISV